jgi:hypothetical protein
MPETFQPYHSVLELPWEEARRAVKPIEAVIASLAASELARLVSEVRMRGFEVERVAVVGARGQNLESIGNPHIRAHAAEGVLFRHVLEIAAEASALRSEAFVEKELTLRAMADLDLSEREYLADLARLGKELGRPWRIDEKLAATAAWLALPERPGER